MPGLWKEVKGGSLKKAYEGVSWWPFSSKEQEPYKRCKWK